YFSDGETIVRVVDLDLHRHIPGLRVSDAPDEGYFASDASPVITFRWRRAPTRDRAPCPDPGLLVNLHSASRSRRQPNDDVQLLRVNDAANLRTGGERLPQLAGQAVQASIDRRAEREKLELQRTLLGAGLRFGQLSRRNFALDGQWPKPIDNGLGPVAR